MSSVSTVLREYPALVYNVVLSRAFISDIINTVGQNTLPRTMFFNKETYNPKTDVPDLAGRVALVTGGNAGLGKVSVLEFARHGAKVYMASRTESKARKAIDEIKAEVPGAQVEYLHLDLTSLQSVKEAADEFLSKESQLHILLNNAGVMAMPAQLTTDGFDIQWGTNHIGHALLTKLLIPTMVRTAESAPKDTVRIVNVASLGHKGASGINFEDTALSKSSAWTRYGQSKLANILHARALAKRYADKGIVAVSLHPGMIVTDLYTPFQKSLGLLGLVIQYPLKLFSKSVVEGSYNQIALCTSPKVTVKDGGSYYHPVMKKETPSSFAQDEKLADKLWEYTENVLKEKGY